MRMFSPPRGLLGGLALTLVGLVSATAYAQEADSELIEYELDPEHAAALEADIHGPTLEGAPPIDPQTEPTPTETPTEVPVALPGGEERSAVTPQAVSLPNAEGSVEGMGESFAPVLSSGTATFSVPFRLPSGRNGVQTSLGLSYASSNGNGPVGVGWSLGAPFIARQTDRGLPSYDDRESWHPLEDRFLYNGGQELVPVSSTEATALDGAPVPAELDGWQQYRARVEGGFMRFFRAPDARRWVVQDQSGTRYEFGVLGVGEGPSELVTASQDALQIDDGRIFAWYLTRTSDAHGSVVVYRYAADQGQRYLSDIHYDSPASCGGASSPADRRRCASPLSSYGRRVRLVYEARSDVFTSYIATYPVRTALRLRRVEITAAEAANARTLVRRYHLGYAPGSFHSLLASVQLEGRPEVFEASAGVSIGAHTVSEASLGNAIVEDAMVAMVGVTFPPLTFEYTGNASFNEAVQRSTASPPHSVDEARSDLFDVNGDGLADLLVTDPARYRTGDGEPATGVFFNGFSGPNATPGVAGGFSDAVPVAVPSGHSSTLALSNPNIVPMDADGDGRADLLHMPRRANYGYFVVARDGASDAISPAAQGWRFVHVPVALPAGLTDPRLDLGRDAIHLRAFDVDNDHLVDVVHTAGTRTQIWRNLGWLPGGDGRFGSAEFTDAWSLSTQPSVGCLPSAGTPLDFENPESRLADMNGDGLQDIVRIRRGRILYWPGRGHGTFGADQGLCGPHDYIDMLDAPQVDIDLAGVRLADVDGDGAIDVIQVGFDRVDVWLNRAGERFGARATIRGTPADPAFVSNVRLADIDGSGTLDVVWARGGDWRWLDLMGGERPRVLRAIDNGLGALTTIDYGTSAEDYLRDLAEAAACPECEGFTWSAHSSECDARLLDRAGICAQRSGGSPVVSTVVRGITTTDRFDVLGREATVTRTEFAFHDGYYEGIEQEFRGFAAADSIAYGDADHPTALTRTHFLQGRRDSSIAADRTADNPDEPLKGLAVRTEAFDEQGRFLSTQHVTHTLVHLLDGLDGRSVRWAFPTQTDELRYDVHAPFGGGDTLTLPRIVRHAPGGGFDAEEETVAIRGLGYAHLRTTVDVFDYVGHMIERTAHGRIRGENGETPDERITTREEPTLLGDGSGWLWRNTGSLVRGVAGAHLSETRTEHDAVGDAIVATQVVWSDQTFEFGGHAHAEALVQDDANLVASQRFDVWGNAIASCGGADLRDGEAGCLRYAELDYDTDFQHFVETERSFVGGAVGDLTATATWDRGLDVMRSAQDPNGYTSETGYDGLGRPVFFRAPNVDGCEGSTVPTVRIAYDLPEDGATRPVSIARTTTELDCSAIGADAIEGVGYVDGQGRLRATLRTGDERHAWVQEGVGTFTARATELRGYQPAFLDVADPSPAAAVSLPNAPFSSAAYDAFGRGIVARAPDGAVSRVYHHALSADACDALDLDPSSPHFATCSTTRTDGHERAIDQVLRNRQPDGTLEFYRLFTEHRDDNAVTRVVRAQTSGSEVDSTVLASVERRFVFDSIGRRIASSDADTDARDASATDANRTWRYVYNRVGDLAGVRDPRGCGQNFYHDRGGRLVGEAYVGCAASSGGVQPAHEVPPGAIGMDALSAPRAVDVRAWFDEYPVELDEVGAPPSGAAGTLGRAVGMADRGQRSLVAYDPRGNGVFEARQVAALPEMSAGVPELVTEALPPEFAELGPDELVRYDRAHTYERTMTFDHAGRVTDTSLPSDPAWAAMGGGGPAPLIGGALTYNRRGLPARAVATIDAAEHPVVEAIEYLRDGLPSRITWGDAAPGHAATVSHSVYDARRRPVRSITEREATAVSLPGAPSLGAVTRVVDQELVWDTADNLTAIWDHRDGAEWAPGHRPRSVEVTHDSLYRVVSADFQYRQQTGSLGVLDDGLDWRDELTRVNADGQTHQGADPERSRPAPMVSRDAPNRPISLTWLYDYLGNSTETTDDAHSFHERSLGEVVNGDAAAGDRPSAIRLASDLPAVASPDASVIRGGWLEVDYTEGGNVSLVTVHGQCRDAEADVCVDEGGPLEARRTSLRTRCACDREQHFQYRWDELNRIAEARRFDRESGASAWSLAARQRYVYDAGNQRVVKSTVSFEEASGGGPERASLYVYPGDFERRGLAPIDGGYLATSGTETQYLVAGARLVWQADAASGGSFDPSHRLTVGLSDLIQSTSAVMDLESGELIESTCFYPNGAREEHWTTEAASVALEPMGFTGKEADEEVGLVYFGHRYLMPHLGRWVSPDPLHVHQVGGGEALNNYHYVSAGLLQARDPVGLTAPARAQAPIEIRSTTSTPKSGPMKGMTVREDSVVIRLQVFDLTDEGLSAQDRATVRRTVSAMETFLSGSGLAIGSDGRLGAYEWNVKVLVEFASSMAEANSRRHHVAIATDLSGIGLMGRGGKMMSIDLGGLSDAFLWAHETSHRWFRAHRSNPRHLLTSGGAAFLESAGDALFGPVGRRRGPRSIPAQNWLEYRRSIARDQASYSGAKGQRRRTVGSIRLPRVISGKIETRRYTVLRSFMTRGSTLRRTNNYAISNEAIVRAVLRNQGNGEPALR